jgi:hypothetical protein
MLGVGHVGTLLTCWGLVMWALSSHAEGLPCGHRPSHAWGWLEHCRGPEGPCSRGGLPVGKRRLADAEDWGCVAEEGCLMRTGPSPNLGLPVGLEDVHGPRVRS